MGRSKTGDEETDLEAVLREFEIAERYSEIASTANKEQGCEACRWLTPPGRSGGVSIRSKVRPGSWRAGLRPFVLPVASPCGGVGSSSIAGLRSPFTRGDMG